MRNLSLASALVLAASFPAMAVASTGLTAVSGAAVWSNTDNQDHSLGWKFSTTGQTITALGYNDHGFSSAHNVGLYNSGGTLLASVAVNGASTLLGGYRYTLLGSTLNLAAGDYYIVGTTQGLNDGWIYEAASFTTNAATTYLGSYYTSGTGGTLALPGTEASERQYLLTNFTSDLSGAVPEPGTWALMLIGFGTVGFSLRRRKVARPAFA